VNAPVRRVALAVMVMITLLMANLTYVQVVKAHDYRTDPRNKRVLYAENARERGQISAGGQVLAESRRVRDREYVRRYPDGAVYSTVTGYFSPQLGQRGLERTENDVLNGSDDRLFVRRLSDLVTGRDPAGGNVVLTVEPRVQEAAYRAMTDLNYVGAVVALRPQTGEILAMVSTPSFDPNELSAGTTAQQQEAEQRLNNADPPVLRNRAIQELYPPGSTFKVVVAAAALANGFTPDSQLTAQPVITLTGTNQPLPNFGRRRCGSGETASLREALARSCNTAFAQLAEQLGEDELRAQADAFGINGEDITIDFGMVAGAGLGEIVDVPSLEQSGIGQRDVRLTPLHNAMVAAAIANRGQLMQPYLVKEIRGQDLSLVDTTAQDSLGQAVDARVAATLTDLMIGSEDNGTDVGKIPGVQIASKTGTAQYRDGAAPHNWYIAFAPAENPQIAVAVLVEDGGGDEDGTGGKVAAPVGRAVIAAGLRETS